MHQGTFENYTGGLKDFKKERKNVQIFNTMGVAENCFNPFWVISTYHNLLPHGYSNTEDANPLFATPKATIVRGVGFIKVPCGKNWLAMLLQRGMRAIGVDGRFTNMQARSCMITSVMQQGLSDNAIREITGHRSSTALKPYKLPSHKWKKSNRMRMLSTICNGGNSLDHPTVKDKNIEFN